jgi:nucleoside-diphosphate-sugar epimerase
LWKEAAEFGLNIDHSFWKEANVLVTGGAGFIGSHLTKKLIDLGAKVVVADNLSRGKLENLSGYLDRISFRKVDLTDLDECILVSKGIDYIFHLASAVGGVQYIFKENVENLTPPAIMNLNVPEAARRNDAKGYVFASSACIYHSKGEELNEFKEEDAYPANPPTTYGWAKIVGEIACKAYYGDYGLRSSALRIFNAYGENENLDPRTSHVIPSLIRKAILYPQEEFVIFGDGTQERAFLYIKDLIEAFLLAMQMPGEGTALNVGSDELVSVNEVAERVISISGKKIEPKHDPDGPRGVTKYCANLEKTRQCLGWTPRTRLENGLLATYSWAKGWLSAERVPVLAHS